MASGQITFLSGLVHAASVLPCSLFRPWPLGSEHWCPGLTFSLSVPDPDLWVGTSLLFWTLALVTY